MGNEQNHKKARLLAFMAVSQQGPGARVRACAGTGLWQHISKIHSKTHVGSLVLTCFESLVAVQNVKTRFLALKPQDPGWWVPFTDTGSRTL